MKKNSLIMLLFVFMIVFITFFNFRIYSDIYNEKMLNVINEIVKENPSIDIGTITKAIENPNSNNEESSVLSEYGYDKEDFYFTDNIENKFNMVLIINIIIALVIIGFYITLSRIQREKRKKEIEELINYLYKINSGDYSVDLERYTEGEFSRLRDQIYKTTVLLKESENNLLLDKKNLKKNLADIAHQLKTPLTSIILMLENITEDEKMTYEKRREYISKVSNQAEKMQYLIEVLLKVSRLDASVIEFKKENIKASELVNKAILNLDYLIKEKNISLNLDIKEDNFIICDKKWQEEALTNILKNAVENSFDKGMIDIKVKDNNFYTSISIKDYGKGISKKMQKQIFERFKKSEHSKGVGIGLNLAKIIIEKDSGMIALDSVINEYTKFEIKYIK